MLNIPGYLHPMTLSECVAEARWQWTVARTLRQVAEGQHTLRIALYEAEARRLMFAAREYKRGVKLVEDMARELGL